MVRLDDGTYGMLPEEWLARIGPLAGMGAAQDGHLRFRRSQAGLLDALLATQPEARCDETFARMREEMRAFDGIAAAEHPEGFVCVTSDEATYAEKREQFEIDCKDRLPPLPPGATERIYEPGVRHAIIRGHDVIDGGEMPWPLGDKIIGQARPLAQLMEMRRQEREKELEVDVAKRNAELLERREKFEAELKARGIKPPLSSEEALKKHDEFEAQLRAHGITPPWSTS